MRRISKRAGSIAFVAALLLAGVAVAAQTATYKLSHPVAGKGTRVTLDVKGDDPAASGQVPRSIAIKGPRGMKVDPVAVAKLCSKADANADTCPAKSRIGGGSAVIYASGPGIGSGNHTATGDIFLTKPLKKGDVAGSELRFSYAGFTVHTVGRVFKISSGPYGVETLFDKLDSAAQVPPPYVVQLKSVHLTFGAHRKVKVKKNGKTKHVRHDLIRTPSKCSGTWPWAITVSYPSGHQNPITGSVGCTSH